MNSVPSSDPKIDTKIQILDAAERQFALLGFAGTSLRAVTRDANVNLAAVHYHFGSKEELFKAAVRRVAEPIVSEQIRRLEQLEQGNSSFSMADVIRAYIAPSLEMLHHGEPSCFVHAQFLGQCRIEPYPIQQLASAEFSLSHEPFLSALQQMLPHQSEQELSWKLDLVVAMLVRVLTQIEQSQSLSTESTQQVDDLIERLVVFITDGMSA
ncbi:MAG: TetR/AcrR family transcriptional regulator [Microcoleaceae cyanobacterium]